MTQTKWDEKLDEKRGREMESTGLTERGYKIAKQLPHGSGIDYKWHVEEKNGKIEASNKYHAMDEYGGYIGSIPFELEINKKNPSSFDLDMDDETIRKLEEDYAFYGEGLGNYIAQTVQYSLEDVSKLDKLNKRKSTDKVS